MEITIDDIKLLYSLSHKLKFVMCYFIFGAVNVRNTGKTPGDFALGLHAKEYHNFVATNIDYSIAFCVFRPLSVLKACEKSARTLLLLLHSG